MRSTAVRRNKAMLFTKKIKASGKNQLPDEKAVTIGRFGEDEAVKFLVKNGYTVIDRNFRAGRNEIDIVASDKNYLIFVEVKSRTYKAEGEMNYGSPSSAVTYNKKQRILAAANEYMRVKKIQNKQPRIDVIEIFFAPSPKLSNIKEVSNINHIINAFGV